jgi:hypothetical protein
MDAGSGSAVVLVPLTIGITALGLLLAGLVWVARRNRAVNDHPILWNGRDYRCPRCAQPMQQGWVMLGKGAIWTDRGAGRPGLFAHIGSALPNTISLHLRPAANMAWRCAPCQLLLVDHEKLVH